MKKENYESLNAQAAIDNAQEANEKALAARIARDAKNELIEILQAWTVLFNNGSVMVFTLLLGLSVVVEVNFSFAIYEDMAQVSVKTNEFMAYFGAGFIVLWGALVSHYLAKSISKSMFNYAVSNLIKSRQGAIPLNAARELVRKLARRDLIIGLLLGIILLTVVSKLSWQRVIIISVITGKSYGDIHRLLPVLAVLVEVYTGIYLSYFWKRLKTVIRLYILKWRFKAFKKACITLTRMAVTYYEYAMDVNEHLSLAKDLVDAIYRWKYRSVDNEDYVDQVDGVKTLTITVMDGKFPAINVHLAGKLINNGNCTSVRTNEMGEGILTWIDEANEVLFIEADGEIFKGPWRANSSTTIYLRKMRRIKAA